ncbi:hypothetical protein KKD49_06180 [Myxococcota bacterium]|nr:hypothetical protein [Myxococcota bacterium]
MKNKGAGEKAMKNKTYSRELREKIVRKILPPNNYPVKQIEEETGISDTTLYRCGRTSQVSRGLRYTCPSVYWFSGYQRKIPHPG